MINRQNSSAFEPRTRAVQKFSDNLSQKDRRDPFRITIGSRSSLNATLGGIKSGANVDLKLLNRSGQVIASSKNKGNKRERIQVGSLEQGVYRLVAELKGKVATKFNLRATTTAIATPNPNPNPSPIPSPNPSPNPSPLPSPNPSPNPNPSPSPAPAPVPVPTPVPTDSAGQTRATAGSLSFGQDYEDFVGTVDTQDFYKFTLDGATSNFPKRLLTGSITGKNGSTLGGSLTVNLFKDGDTNPLKTKVISGAGGSLFDSATEQFDSGDYFVEITSSDTAVDYKFSLTSAVPDNGGNFDSAITLNVADSTGVNPTVSDFVGAGDADDVYAFTPSANEVLYLKLNRNDGGAPTNPIQLSVLNPDGSTGDSVTLTGATLEDTLYYNVTAGSNYQIVVNDGSNDGTNYTLEYAYVP